MSAGVSEVATEQEPLEGTDEKSEEEEEEEEEQDEPEEAARGRKKRVVPGIVYLGHVPPRFRPLHVRNLLSAYGEVGRVFFQAEGKCTGREGRRMRLYCSLGCVVLGRELRVGGGLAPSWPVSR